LIHGYAAKAGDPARITSHFSGVHAFPVNVEIIERLYSIDSD
jgi:hypothetical protein